MMGLALSLPVAFGQRTCGSADHLQQMLQDPAKAKAYEKTENQIRNWVQEHGEEHRMGSVITIPVVVHVVYRTATQNISQAQIQSQIDVLNKDYRKLNTDISSVPTAWQGIAADAEIQFCLAQRDPNGAPTTGINRVQTTVTSFGINGDPVKSSSTGGADAWPSSQYLNMWVCNLGGGLLGYAQFPGGAAATDGVVIGYNFFGTTGAVSAPYNKGRTTTHEVGHWLGLYHIWGDDGGSCNGSDQVGDTPNQASETYGCYAAGTVRTDNCAATAPGYMWMNYMDYTDDACMYMFTEGQKTRMRAVLNGARSSLQNSLGCVPVVLQPDDAGITTITQPTGSICGTSITPVVTLFNWGSNPLTSATITWQIDNGPVNTFNWTGNLASTASTSVTLTATNVAPGAHTITVSTNSPNGQTDGDNTNDSQTGSFTITTPQTATPAPFSYNFTAATFPPTNWSITNPDADFTWERSATVGLNGAGAAFVNNYDYNADGEVDDLILPTLDLSSGSGTLTFDVAYALYTSPTANPSYSDTLTVLGSTDCGVTWTQLYKKFSTNLTTVTPAFQTAAFVPTQASQWRGETVSLGNLSGQPSVIIKFRNTTQYENNLYVDNINITTSVGVDNAMLDRAVTVYPNPGTGLYTVAVNLEGIEVVQFELVNSLGQRILSFREEGFGTNDLALDLQNQPEGVYFLRAIHGDAQIVKKIVKY
jgi:hypothetical protein